MDNKQFNQQGYNRRKQFYRFILGFQQMINHPVINIIWILFAVGVVYLVIGERKIIMYFDVYPMFAPIFYGCMNIMLIVFPIICAIGIVQFIGVITAMKDEANMSIVFGDKQDIKNQPPILIHKKTDKKNGVTKREFYTTIPMERWQEKKEALCDRLNIHLIGDISYGGKNRNKGNHIYFESAKGRKAKERGEIYDDTF